MIAESELKARAKLEWEAASERLGNLLVPPISGMPEATPKALRECFDLLQSRLDTLRAAYRVPGRND